MKKNREKLIGCGLDAGGSTPGTSFRAIPVLLHCLKLSLAAEEDVEGSGQVGGGGGSVSISEQILLIMERLLVEATQSVPSVQVYCQFASSSVAKEDIVCLLQHAVALKAGTALHQRY